MSISPHEILRHILDEARYLKSRSSEMEKGEFLHDETGKRAFVRSIEIIGEASRRLPDSFRNSHPEMDWRAMMGMRDRLIHDYFGVDYDIVWDVACNKTSDLIARIERILQSETR